MAAAPPPWPHTSAATKTRIPFGGEGVINVTRKPSSDKCSVRLRGRLLLSHGWRRFGPKGWFVDAGDPVEIRLDRREKIYHLAAFTCIEICRQSIHNMLDEAPATREHDLATGNWVDPIFSTQPHDIAMAIARFFCREIEEILDVELTAVPVVRAVFPGYDVEIEIPKLRVSLVYTEPRELLLAWKEPAVETVAARVSARRRKRRRREPAGELCAICLLDILEAEDEEAVVRLPCSHPFHGGCIQPWFHRALTCPTCRHDIMQCFPRGTIMNNS